MSLNENMNFTKGGGAQWFARLIRNVEVLGSNPIKDNPEQANLPLFLSTVWFQERIRA